MLDRGSMTLTVLFVGMAMTGAVLAALLPLSADLIDRQRARAAADAAALAGVTGGSTAAATLASDNGAVLVAWSRRGRTVTVSVRVGDQVAIARATDAP